MKIVNIDGEKIFISFELIEEFQYNLQERCDLS